MGGLALLAREAGFEVTGSDRNIYPPMSTQLADSGITLVDGYEAQQLSPAPDSVVAGNALSRGQPVVEAMLDQGLTYTSGPEWLGRHILQDQWVLAVSGTHGKTSTASMLAWILDCAGLKPGFLIGGVPGNFGVSARLGQGRFFVVGRCRVPSVFPWVGFFLSYLNISVYGLFSDLNIPNPLPTISCNISRIRIGVASLYVRKFFIDGASHLQLIDFVSGCNPCYPCE